MDKFIEREIVYEYDDDKYKIIFSTAQAGNMAYQAIGETVLENRKKISQYVGVELDKFIFAKQSHSNKIARVDSSSCGRGVYSFEDGIEGVDGLYTFENKLPLCAFYADCTPVYIMSEVDNLTCVIHAGWQGTVTAITYNAIEHFKTIGIDPQNLRVIIGPSISFEQFEVEADVIELIDKLQMIETKLCYKRINDIKHKVDVKFINKLQAMACGVPEENIDVSTLCTYQNDNLFSFRQNNQTGRMIACIFKK